MPSMSKQKNEDFWVDNSSIVDDIFGASEPDLFVGKKKSNLKQSKKQTTQTKAAVDSLFQDNSDNDSGEEDFTVKKIFSGAEKTEKEVELEKRGEEGGEQEQEQEEEKEDSGELSDESQEHINDDVEEELHEIKSSDSMAGNELTVISSTTSNYNDDAQEDPSMKLALFREFPDQGSDDDEGTP